MISATASVPPDVTRVADAIAEPGCPQLFDLLDPDFQNAVPREKWAAFCASVGRMTDLEARPAPGLYAAKGPRGPLDFRVSFSAQGKVNGLSITPSKEPPKYTATELAPLLEEIVKARKVPGLGVLALVDGKLVALEVAGVRKQGDSTRVTKADVWHLGSDTKAMTATLAAMLVEAGTWRWSSTLPQLFPGLSVHPSLQSVTLDQLLHHRSGLPANVDPALWPPGAAPGAKASTDRQAVAKAVIALPPEGVGDFKYSNTGYIVVGAALELATKKSWEQLMKERLFGPLGMRSCGFGVQARAPSVDQPWPHRWANGAAEPQLADWHADNHPGLGPAGTVSCSLEDWSKFVALFAGGAGKKLLKPETLAHLGEPEGTYAAGWLVDRQPWSEGPVLTHSGSNTMNFATAWISPGSHAAFLAVTNVGDEAAGGAALNDALRFLIGDTLKKLRPSP